MAVPQTADLAALVYIGVRYWSRNSSNL